MSRLDELIKELCPDGVEYKTIGEIGKFYGGLSGKSKEDFKDGNAKFISYINVFNNPAVNINASDTVKVAKGERQNIVQYGDIIFTGSSETMDECGMSSVLTEKTEDVLYLNSFCFGLRLENLNLLLPDYAKHLFRSHEIRKQIIKTASGVTRFNVSKKKMEKVTIPLPPLEVQEEIVRILDNFTELTAELTAELSARRKQYEYYRDMLLAFGDDVEWKTLGEVAQYSSDRVPCNLLTEKNYVGVDNLLPNKAGKTVSNYVPTGGNFTGYTTGDILIGNIRPYLKKIWLADCNGGTNGDVLTIRVIDQTKVLSKYLFYILSSDNFFNYDMQHSKGAKMPRGDKTSVMRYLICFPPLEEQKRIVDILDRFDKLCNDISEGLPAEIEARKKQYEYYRDKLLTFKEKAVL